MSDQYILLLVAFTSSMLTFFVNEQLKQGPVRSSALLSLVVALYFHFFPGTMNCFLVNNIPLVYIGGSFIGMVSSRLLSSYLLIGTAGIIFCLIFLHASKFFTGYGGAMGTAASIAVLTVLSLPVMGKHHRVTNGIMQLRQVLLKAKKH